MDTSAWETLAQVVPNLLIAGAYVGIGLFIAPKFQVAGNANRDGARLARLAALVFFVACALTHVELAVHSLIGEVSDQSWMAQWHGFLIHGAQAVAGWAFLFLAARYLSIYIRNKEEGGELDQIT